MRISDWSSDVCSSDLRGRGGHAPGRKARHRPGRDGVARQDRPQGPAPRLGGQPRAGAVEGAGHRYTLASLALEGKATRARPREPDGSGLTALRLSGATRRNDFAGKLAERGNGGPLRQERTRV